MREDGNYEVCETAFRSEKFRKLLTVRVLFRGDDIIAG